VYDHTSPCGNKCGIWGRGTAKQTVTFVAGLGTDRPHIKWQRARFPWLWGMGLGLRGLAKCLEHSAVDDCQWPWSTVFMGKLVQLIIRLLGRHHLVDLFS